MNEREDIIDETFAGLAEPAEVHPVGREDITSGRPGEILVDEVRSFRDAGGFERLVAEREARRLAEEAADAARVSGDGPLPDFGLREAPGEAKAPETAPKDSDEE